MKNEIILKTGNTSLLCEIGELWEELNQIHMEKSLYFVNHYKTLTFEARAQSLLAKAEKGKLFIAVAYHEEIKIGYCVSSIVDDIGEIESIFIKPDYRSMHIGHMLMDKAVEWINSHYAKNVEIAVSIGNEEVFGFYEIFGFKPRLTVLQLGSDQL